MYVCTSTLCVSSQKKLELRWSRGSFNQKQQKVLWSILNIKIRVGATMYLPIETGNTPNILLSVFIPRESLNHGIYHSNEDLTTAKRKRTWESQTRTWTLLGVTVTFKPWRNLAGKSVMMQENGTLSVLQAQTPLNGRISCKMLKNNLVVCTEEKVGLVRSKPNTPDFAILFSISFGIAFDRHNHGLANIS